MVTKEGVREIIREGLQTAFGLKIVLI